MQPHDLYELDPVRSNPLFHDFNYRDSSSPSLLGRGCRDDDLTPGFDSEENRNWTQPSLGDGWTPIEVVGNVPDSQDFVSLACLPVFSKRACDALREFLEPNGELLPLKSETRMLYFFYNITRIADVLNVNESECDFFCDPPTSAVDIDYFSFHRAKLDGLSIFRIPQMPVMTIVSDHFVQRVLDSGLLGFSFTKIWPLARGTRWRHPKERVQIETTGMNDNPQADFRQAPVSSPSGAEMTGHVPENQSAAKPSVPFTVYPFTERLLIRMGSNALEAAGNLGIDLSTVPPDAVIAAVNDFVRRVQKDGTADRNVPLLMGSLWGQAIVQSLGWEWAVFHFDSDHRAFAVHNPERSLVMFPVRFVEDCLRGRDVTIALAYGMLRNPASIPQLPPGSYTNVMDHVHHIIPPL